MDKEAILLSDDGETLLDAPCVFCGYNSLSYWQAKTHSKLCPWYSVGGIVERKSMLRKVIDAYRKPQGWPPLVEIPKASDFTEEDAETYIKGYKDGVQVQRDADIKYYEGSE